MYAAVRAIRVQRPCGKAKLTQLKPGDPVPEALGWSERVLIAHRTSHIRGADERDYARWKKEGYDVEALKLGKLAKKKASKPKPKPEPKPKPKPEPKPKPAPKPKPKPDKKASGENPEP